MAEPSKLKARRTEKEMLFGSPSPSKASILITPAVQNLAESSRRTPVNNESLSPRVRIHSNFLGNLYEFFMPVPLSLLETARVAKFVLPLHLVVTRAGVIHEPGCRPPMHRPSAVQRVVAATYDYLIGPNSCRSEERRVGKEG